MIATPPSQEAIVNSQTLIVVASIVVAIVVVAVLWMYRSVNAVYACESDLVRSTTARCTKPELRQKPKLCSKSARVVSID